MNEGRGFTMKTEARITIYSAYWAYYISQHQRPGNRALHYLGSMSVLFLAVAALTLQVWWLVPVALACAFGPGMIGHALIEKTPADRHHYPLWAIASDFRMLDLFLGRRLPPAFFADAACGLERPQTAPATTDLCRPGV